MTKSRWHDCTCGDEACTAKVYVSDDPKRTTGYPWKWAGTTVWVHRLCHEKLTNRQTRTCPPRAVEDEE